MSTRKFTILDTDSSNYPYEYYVMYRRGAKQKVMKEDSVGYQKWIREMKEYDIKEMLRNFKDSNLAKRPLLLTGTIQTWNGKKNIYPAFVETTKKKPAINAILEKCMSGMDDIKIEYDNGQIKLYCKHHDGTNEFTVSRLTCKGLKLARNAQKNNTYIQDTKPYIFGVISETDIAF